MSRRCQLTGKSKDFGFQRSHSLRQTIKHREVNLHTVRLSDGSNLRTVRVAASTLRTLYRDDQRVVRRHRQAGRVAA